jgi:integrase
MQRSLLVFQESCKSKYTQKQYLYYLDKFKGFYKLKDYDSILGIEATKLQLMVEDYVMDLKKRVSPNTVPTMIFGIKAFLDANDIELRWKKIQKLFPDKIKPSGPGAYSKEQIKLLLDVSKDVRTRALILFLASSGVRIGAIPDLKLKHLMDYENCKIITVYEGTKDEYYTFLTPEATQALNEYMNKRNQYGEYFDKETPVFRTVFNVKYQKVRRAGRAALQEIIRRVLMRAGLRSGHENKRYDIQIDHGFRKFFNQTFTDLENINLSKKEQMMGHSTTIPLDNNYNKKPYQILFEEYRKVIPYLTINDTARKEAIIEEQKKKISELEMMRAQLNLLTDKIHILEATKGQPLTKTEEIKQILRDNPELLENLKK